jgi:hypothetical protein
MIAGAWAALTRNVGAAKKLDWIAAVAGVWLIVASFIFRDPVGTAGLLNDLIVGMIVTVLGVWTARSALRAAR